MIHSSKGFHFEFIENNDAFDIAEVYNSNKEFLISHMDKECVTAQWMQEEIQSMKDTCFSSFKIVDEHTDRIIGSIDFKLEEETYLSLLILHKDYKNKGMGNAIYQTFEDYVKQNGSKCIRIDVVVGYNDNVLRFWTNHGFEMYKSIELNWTGKPLPAVVMKKTI